MINMTNCKNNSNVINENPSRDMAYYLASWEQRNRRLGAAGIVTIDGLAVAVNAGVFSPDPSLTHSTIMLMHSLPKLKGKSVLDLGTGCGIIALDALRKGASQVAASDIQPEAIANARENARTHRALERVEIVESDVFDKIVGSYDVIVANLPFMVASYEFNHIATENYRRFFAGLTKRLSPAGAAYLSFGSWGDLATLHQMIEHSGLKANTIIEERPDASWYVFQLYTPSTRCLDLWHEQVAPSAN